MPQKPEAMLRMQPSVPSEIASAPATEPMQNPGSVEVPVRMDPRALDRMYEVVSVLQDDYTDILIKQTDSLEQNCLSLKDNTEIVLQRIYETAHEIRGIAGTFGRPLAGKIAAHICDYLDRPKTDDIADPRIIQEQVGTLVQIASFTPEPEGIFASIVMKRLEDTASINILKKRP